MFINRRKISSGTVAIEGQLQADLENSSTSSNNKKEYSAIALEENLHVQINYFPEVINKPINQALQFINELIPKALNLKPGFHIVNEDYKTYGEYEDFKADHSVVLQAGDTIFIAHAQQAIEKFIKTMPWESKGITTLSGASIYDVPAYGYGVVELYISAANPFVGQVLGEVAAEFSATYECTIISAKSINDFEDNVDDLFKRQGTLSTVINQGTSILVVTHKNSYSKLLTNRHFINVVKSGTLEVPATYWSFFPAIVFLTIVSLVAAEQVEMTPAALSMAGFFFVGGWLWPEDIEKYVDLRLLMLMGCSLSFATAMTKTGLAQKIADEISYGVSDPLNCLFLIYLATLFITEIISNNAAAALMFPVAVKLADRLGVSYKPFAMTVMQAASMAFMCPIGYPTHVMVWRPGNYSFMDFCKFGLIPDILWMIVSCLICPLVWKF